jgi:hypothetical protein
MSLPEEVRSRVVQLWNDYEDSNPTLPSEKLYAIVAAIVTREFGAQVDATDVQEALKP